MDRSRAVFLARSLIRVGALSRASHQGQLSPALRDQYHPKLGIQDFHLLKHNLTGSFIICLGARISLKTVLSKARLGGWLFGQDVYSTSFKVF